MPIGLVIGIGNPGREYENTRHNWGFMVLDAWAGRLHYDWETCRFAQALECQVRPGLRLMKPMTYVNRSGQVARAALEFDQLRPEQMLVVVDDVNLDLGRLRLRPRGSSGGHNGLKSIESALGSAEYARLRGGVGRCPADQPLEDWVLQPLRGEELQRVKDMTERATQVLDEVIQDRWQSAVQKAGQSL